jgi:hypothetical protein
MRRACTRCNHTGKDKGNWNGNLRQGVLIEIICPRCQSAQENAEAEINESTLIYRGLDAFGRVIASPKC